MHWNEGRCTSNMHVCMDAYDLVLGCVYGIAHRELHTCAVSCFSHPCACSFDSNYIGAEAAHCCSTCPQLDAPNTQVSTIHSLLACVVH
jgi:hypothetical protein